MSPTKVLSRGYSYITNSDGNAVTEANRLNIGDKVHINFSKGGADAEIVSVAD